MNGLATLTPSQVAARADHKARLARIAAAAIVRKPLVRPARVPVSEPEQLPVPLPFPFPWLPNVEIDLGRITIERIKTVVCRDFGLTRGELIANRRTKNVVRPRQIAMYLAKELTLRSLPDIGRRFGGRDHTTVLHAVRKMTQMVADDAELARRIDALRRELGETDA